MNNLQDIRRRLRTVENIKKITSAMERVAAVRLRRAQEKAQQSIPYVKKMKEILGKLASTGYSHPLFEQRKVKKIALIVVTGDKGLSGSYNSNILYEANQFLKQRPTEQVDLVLFGKKGIDYFKNRKWNIAHQMKNWGGKISFHDVNLFMHQIVNEFLNGKYDEVYLLYTHYISIMRREVKIEKFLNIEKFKTETEKKVNYIFEPSPEEIYSEILPRYTVTRMQGVLDEAYAAELSARIVAMQTATKNSENMIESLTLVRNKLRQEGITKEIIEISNTMR